MLDDIAESYLAADPDLVAGYSDAVATDPLADDGGGGSFHAANGWHRGNELSEPGTSVSVPRAAWWDHAIQSRPSVAAGSPDTAVSSRLERVSRIERARTLQRAAKAGRLPAVSTASTPAPLTPAPPTADQDQDPDPDQNHDPDPDQARPPAPYSGRPARSQRRRHGPVTAGVAALALVLIAAAMLTLVLSSRSSHQSARPASATQVPGHLVAVARAKARSAAASWIAAQVRRRATVACDPAMCGALIKRGFPARDLRPVGRTASVPLTAALVVVTPAISRQFGPGVTGRWAPAVLASFGQGSNRVDVRIVAPRGAAAYESALSADRKLSKNVGTGLVTSRQIAASAAARKAMTSGLIDARILIVLTALTSENPIDILDFGASQKGATPGLPLRVADLAATDEAAHLTEKVYVQALEELLRAQPPRYRPVRLAIVSVGGRRALRIEFSAPTPLRLLNQGG